MAKSLLALLKDSGEMSGVKDWIPSFLDEVLARGADEARKKKAICILQHHLNQGMPEMTDEQRKHFYDSALSRIFNLLNKESSSNNPIDVKAGVMLMCILLDAPGAEKNKPTICPPFANHLRKVNLNLQDHELLDLIACAIGKIALNSGSSQHSFVEFEIDRALEMMHKDERNDLQRRHSAILNMRELANVIPSYFFSHLVAKDKDGGTRVMLIFENIFKALNEQKMREAATSALRSILQVVVERERLASVSSSTTPNKSVKMPSAIDQQISECFDICYNEVVEGFRHQQSKDHDDKIHASLLILNELFRCSHDSSFILRDSISRKLDFLYVNLTDFNDMNYLSNFLLCNVDYPASFFDCPDEQSLNDLVSPTAGSSTASSRSLRSGSNLTKLLRNHTGLESANMPLYGVRDLQSVVSYHKEMGLAPILTLFQGGRKPRALSSQCHKLIEDNFQAICEHIISLLRMKNSIQINQVLLLVLPNLTSFKPDLIAQLDSFVKESIQYLLNCIKNPSLKSLAFISLGLFALAIKDVKQNRLEEQLPVVVGHIRETFPTRDPHSTFGGRGRHRISTTQRPDPAVYTCLAFLAQAVGSKLRIDIQNMLDSMFALGLSEPLANSLHDICKYIPELKEKIHERLISLLRHIVKPYEVHEREKTLSLSKGLNSGLTASEIASKQYDIDTLKLALKVLGRFEFASHQMLYFVSVCAEHYLRHESREIRLEAVHTCCQLLKPFLNQTYSKIARRVVCSLLQVGVTDLDKYVRYSVLSRLDDDFDYFLAQAENLDLLKVSINDEVFEIRELSICILGRLCSLNPAYVMPYLRTELLSLLNELEASGLPKNMEQSARMLGHLLAATPRLIRPFTETILKVFLPRLNDPTPAVSTAVMSAIGEQAVVSGLEMRAWFWELFPIVLDAVQDTSSLQKREIALWTMGRLIENCGHVIEPYKKFPNLLDVIFSILRTESTKSSELVRREAIRVLGLLGAMDPYQHKIHLGYIDISGESLVSYDPTLEQECNSHDILSNITGSTFEDYLSQQAISTLVATMGDPNASTHHTIAVQSVVFIFKVLGLRSVAYLPQILPPFINIIRTGEPLIKEFLLQQLGQIISVVQKHVRNYLDDIFKVLRELWTMENANMQLTLFGVIDQIALALGGEFRKFVPHLIPHILRVFNHDSSSRKEVTYRLLGALQNFGTNLEDYVHLLVPPIVRLFENEIVSNSPNEIRREIEIKIQALKTIEIFCDDLNLLDFSARIIRGIIQVFHIANQHTDCTRDQRLIGAALDTLSSLIAQLEHGYLIYKDKVDPVLKKNRSKFPLESHVNYLRTMKAIFDNLDPDDNKTLYSSLNSDRKLGPLVTNYDALLALRRQRRVTQLQMAQTQIPASDAARKNMQADQVSGAWEKCSRRISKEDWLEWLFAFNIDLINQSPSIAIRACYPIAQACNSVARELFNSAFLSCWELMLDPERRLLVGKLEDTLREQEIPEVTGAILNLAEFLEHIEKTGKTMFDAKLLAERALKCRAYAKALHYKEIEFLENQGSEVLGALIAINNKLQQPQSAYGALHYALKNLKQSSEVKEKWYEKLHNYEAAYKFYRTRYENNQKDYESVLGQMRCLEVMSDWQRLYQLAQETWVDSNEQFKQKMARMVTSAAWGLGHWDDMKMYSKHIPMDNADSAFYDAVIKIHEKDYDSAQFFIDRARQLIDTDLTTMAAESYSRAYPAMVQVQMMSELEEVIQYKLVPERREMIKQKWWNRVLGCQNQVEDWQKILQVRSLVLDPRQDMRSWLKFSKICEMYNRADLSIRTIVNLLGVHPHEIIRGEKEVPLDFPEVAQKCIDHLWFLCQFKRAYVELANFTTKLEESLESGGLMPNPPFSQFYNLPVDSDGDDPNLFYAQISQDANLSQDKLGKVLARSYLRQATWQEILVGFSDRSIPSILKTYQQATERDKDWYKAWHMWAFMNFRALKQCKERQPELRKSLDAPLDMFPNNRKLEPRQYAINAVKGFFKSVYLSKSGSSLQDTLRILTVWFEDGHDDQVRIAVEQGIRSVKIETWLQVIPQLIARIDMPCESVSKLVHNLLTDIGKYHPQALTYPLMVATKSLNTSRSHAANQILQLMRVHSPNLVKQAILVSEELIRIAILWHELWHEGLEEASRLYFGDKNIDGMFDTLEPLHQMIKRPPNTLKELTFCQNYGNDLEKAYSYCNRYKETHDSKNLNQAWEIYYNVFRRISRQLPQLTSLELEYVSPKLTQCTDLELAVPGAYYPQREVICIAKVEPQLNIITSKQRPRKLTIKGSNGHNYMFLLKGHEDLRQDERVMQLFGLVNTLLNMETSTSRQNLAIQRYAVIPLAPNSGLIGWVPCCDTLHSLIRDYREKRKILLNMEHRLMLRMAPDFDRLPLPHKVEVFEHALSHTPGDDLSKILWLKSPSSEVWFDRRTNYTRSLAVMSMVGYILGLGDRHPSNLMLDRISGKILHIDFGDCFEVAMTREKYPEKIPFRLTRMLIKAMEVTGLEGTFRIVCQGVMFVLRKNKESVMALLEAFVYDPLLNWRLVDAQPKPRQMDRLLPVDAQETELVAEEQEDPDMRGGGEITFMPKRQPLPGPSRPPTNRASVKRDSRHADLYAYNEGLNQKAVAVIGRVRDKLTGHDFIQDMTQPIHHQNKLNLFGDDEEEGDDVVEQLEPFKAEHRFSERKTSKLIELKSKYAYDPRFKIDERFIDDDPDDDDDDNEPKSEVENEKAKNLEILEKVLGKKITKPEPPMEASKKGFAVRSSLLTPRFDPSKEECKVYELEPKSATKRKVVNLDLDEIDRKIEKSKKVRFDVEEKKEKKKVDVGESYYEVQEDLKNTMANTEDFSLGSFLGLEPAGEMDEAKNEVDRRNEEATYEPITDHKYRTRNPFKYDSSESEGEEDDEGQDEAQQSEERDDKVKITIPKDTRPIPQLKPFAGFFFTENDARFEEDLFYTKELVEKTKNNGKERSILMMRALSLRKKSATKNLKTEQKFTKKQKERQKFMRKNRKQMRKRMVFNQRNAKKRSQR